jgi:hypothetical protein
MTSELYNTISGNILWFLIGVTTMNSITSWINLRRSDKNLKEIQEHLARARSGFGPK